MNVTTAPPEYWDTHYEQQNLVYEEQSIPFRELFDRFMPRGGDCFEVGCYPGPFSIYLAKRFGFRVNGIDTTPFVSTHLPAHLREQNVEVGELIQGDFFTYDAERTFDVVCSFGFIEHFKDYKHAIERHLNLLSDDGTLVISTPNFRNIQYFLHRWLDAENLERHVLAAMSLREWRKQLESAGLKIIWQGYYRTADFWWESSETTVQLERKRLMVRRALQAIDRRISWPNRWLSPYMITFAKRVSDDDSRPRKTC